MKGMIPHVNPTEILKFFNLHAINSVKLKPGETVVLTYPSLVDYFVRIPEELRYSREYSSEYHNALLKMAQLLVNEGLLIPAGNASGLEQHYSGNGFDANLANYGHYDFMIFGFPVIRKNFEEAVRPVLVNHNNGDKKPGIGTGFTVARPGNLYFVTARHCLPPNDLITIQPFLPPDPLHPVNIFAPANKNIDLVVIETSDRILISDKYFYLDLPEVLDPVLTMGYPPIQGFTEAVQIAETANIATELKSTTGQVTGAGKHYWGGLQDHFLISARVKGGNSGGPVINKFGKVVGVIIESLQNEGSADLLGYGMAISASVLKDLFLSIEGKENKLDFEKLPFEKNDKGFWLT